jgi:hypothetical protein
MPYTENFAYRGFRFLLRVAPQGAGTFMGNVSVIDIRSGAQGLPLPTDADPYRTAIEALRNCEQQAIRWANDQTGDGQGQF